MGWMVVVGGSQLSHPPFPSPGRPGLPSSPVSSLPWEWMLLLVLLLLLRLLLLPLPLPLPLRASERLSLVVYGIADGTV